jgi:hypothetical protein
VPFSESYDNAAWASNGTVVANQGVSPSGYTDADLFYSTTGTGRRIFDAVTITSGSTYTSSVFAKASGKSFIFFPDVDNITNSVWFNLSNGTFSTPIEGTATMVDYGNGWYRCSLTTTSTGTTGYSYVGISDASGSVSFTQNGTDGVLLWGSQLEFGAYESSYINTNGTSVTRLAEAFSKSSISSLIGQTEGTFLVDFIYSNTDTSVAQIFSISDEGTTNRVYIGSAFSQSLQSVVTSGGTAQANIGTSFPMVLGQRYRAALAYKANDFAFYVNGVQIGTDNAGTVPVMNYISNSSGGGSSPANYPLNQMLLFKTRLTNAQLAELTTL